MAHPEQMKFVEIVVSHLLRKSWCITKVLEIGSHDVNGSVRSFFCESEYLGVDLSPGKGVDIIASGDKIDLPDYTFDVVISCECFEHNPMWVETFQNMYRMLKAGGVMIVTCASKGRLEHGTTRTSPNASPGTQALGWNYYKNLRKIDFRKHFQLSDMFEKFAFYTNGASQDLYFVGNKKGRINDDALWDNDALSADVRQINRMVRLSNGVIRPWYHRIIRAPLSAAALFLPENIYQIFGIFYTRITNKVIFFFRRLTASSVYH